MHPTEAKNIIRWLAARENDSTSSQGWWLLTRRGAPRFLVPTDPVSWQSASRMVHGGMQKIAFSSNLRFKTLWGGPGDWLAPNTTSPIDQWLQDATPEATVHKAVYLGTPSIFAKDTIQCQSACGKVMAYAKISKTPHAEESVTNEAKILNLLSETSPEETFYPKILKSEKGISLQSPSPEIAQCKAQEGARDILLNLSAHSSQQITWDHSPTAGVIRDAISVLNGKGMSDWAEPLKRQFDSLTGETGIRLLPHHLSHGDFVPWNLHGRFAFDWEWAGIDLPWQDLLHYTLFPLLTRRICPSKKTWETSVKRMAIRLALNGETGFPPFDPLWSRIYLAKRFAFYSKSAIQNGDDPRTFRFLRNIQALMLQH